MFKNISYRNRFYIVILLMTILATASYFFAIRNTISVVHECNYYKDKTKSYELLQSQESQLKSDLLFINQVIVNDSATTDEFSKQIFDFISHITNSHEVAITNFDQPLVSDESGFKVETYSLTISGTFIQLLKACNEIEKKIKIGRMVSMDFYTEKKSQKKTEELYLNIYIQCVKKIS